MASPKGVFRKALSLALPDRLRSAIAEDWVAVHGWSGLRYARLSYSQEGEDLVLARLFEGRGPGFYVDVGAHHPQHYSNTCLLYRRGWRGINIDAMPGSMADFQRMRPGDTNLEIGISSVRGGSSFYVFNLPALNTFSASQRDAHLRAFPEARVLREIPVQHVPLADVLARHLPVEQRIDVLTVDVEGRDLDVLISNDWARYRPEFVLAESLRMEAGWQGSEDDTVSFMKSVGYAAVCRTVNTLFFSERSGALA